MKDIGCHQMEHSVLVRFLTKMYFRFYLQGFVSFSKNSLKLVTTDCQKKCITVYYKPVRMKNAIFIVISLLIFELVDAKDTIIFGSTLCDVSDDNECETSRMCANGVCRNLRGSYKCICNLGYVLAPGGNVCIGNVK